jgi:hypothetical protein
MLSYLGLLSPGKQMLGRWCGWAPSSCGHLVIASPCWAVAPMTILNAYDIIDMRSRVYALGCVLHPRVCID